MENSATSKLLMVAQTLSKIEASASDDGVRRLARIALDQIEGAAKKHTPVAENVAIELADDLEGRAEWESRQPAGASAATIDVMFAAVSKLRDLTSIAA